MFIYNFHIKAIRAGSFMMCSECGSSIGKYTVSEFDKPLPIKGDKNVRFRAYA